MDQFKDRILIEMSDEFGVTYQDFTLSVHLESAQENGEVEDDSFLDHELKDAVELLV
jgi:hypothetical protein